MARPRKYQTEEERKAAHNESNRKWHKKILIMIKIGRKKILKW